MSMIDILRSVAPSIATALGGPLAGLAVGFISKQFGVDPDKVAEVVAGADPVRLREIELDFQKYMAGLGIQLQLAQIATNTEEAKSASTFVAGWRPFAGWIGGVALAYAAILEPLLRFASHVWGGYNGDFPVIDTNLTLQVLMGMLGLSGLRSWEKGKDVQDKH